MPDIKFTDENGSSTITITDIEKGPAMSVPFLLTELPNNQLSLKVHFNDATKILTMSGINTLKPKDKYSIAEKFAKQFKPNSVSTNLYSNDDTSASTSTSTSPMLETIRTRTASSQKSVTFPPGTKPDAGEIFKEFTYNIAVNPSKETQNFIEKFLIKRYGEENIQNITWDEKGFSVNVRQAHAFLAEQFYEEILHKLNKAIKAKLRTTTVITGSKYLIKDVDLPSPHSTRRRNF